MSVSEKLIFRVLIDGLLFDGAALRYFDREALLRMLPMKGAITFASGSTSPGTLPRTAWMSAAGSMAVVTLGVRFVPLVDVVRVCACGLCAPCCVVLLGSWNGTIAPFQHVQRVRGQKYCP